jgi:hypothetical protein
MGAPALAWSLPADATAPARARALLAFSPRDRLGPGGGGTLALLLSENVTNSVRHAGLTDADRVECTITVDDVIHVEVWDPGPGFAAAPAAPHTDAGSGWGLVFLDKLSIRWGVRSAHPTCVWFELDTGIAGDITPPANRSLAQRAGQAG